MPLGDVVIRRRLERVEKAIGRLAKARRFDPKQTQMILIGAIVDLLAAVVALNVRDDQ